MPTADPRLDAALAAHRGLENDVLIGSEERPDRVAAIGAETSERLGQSAGIVPERECLLIGPGRDRGQELAISPAGADLPLSRHMPLQLLRQQRKGICRLCCGRALK